MTERIFRNYLRFDVQVFGLYVPHIDKYRFAKLLRKLYDSVIADGIDSDSRSVEEHDKMFEPRTEPEEMFWKSCRQIAKFDLETLKKKIDSGKKGGRPVATKEEQQATLDNFTNTFGKPTGANEVRITKGFKLPAHPYFDSYHKTYPAQLIKNVEQWLVKTKLGENVEYQWIGKQIQNFNKRKTGKVF